ncbi:MAG: LysE family transporter [Lautropia sp.]|nr:LysE family transporter [Lautropia sp.]
MNTLLTAFLLSLSLVTGIGAQNAFLLRQGLLGQHVALVVLICFVGDLLLMSTGVLGLGNLFSQNRVLTLCLAVAGIAFVLMYGSRALLRAWRPTGILEAANVTVAPSRRTVASTALAVSFLNPQGLLETLVIIGSVSASLPAGQKPVFLLGAVSASALWFLVLGYGARLLRPLFRQQLAWQLLDLGTGVLMLFIAWRMVVFFF